MQRTVTELMRNTSDVLNDVQALGQVTISGRRPDMILITQERFNQMLQEAYDKGAYKEYKAIKAMESK